MNEDQFYRDQYQKLLMDKLEDIQGHLKTQDTRLMNIESKVTWIFAWVAGVGAASSLFFFWIKNKFFT
jgi:hypothetical protein